jgi:hypothetical protein
MKREAMLYERGGQIYITPESLTLDGFWAASGTVFAVDSTATKEIAERLLRAFELSTAGAPTPPPGKNLMKPVLALAGVSSFGRFMHGTAAVRGSLSDEGLRLTPMRNAGPKEGFQLLQDESVLIEPRVDLVADALTRLLALARDAS